MITVGTNSFGYNHERNYSGLPFRNVKFEKVHDIYKIPSYLSYKLFNKVVNRLVNRFDDFGFNKVNLYHFFNTISPIKKPWLVTFETSVPRLEPNFLNGYKWLCGPYCIRLIAISKRAFDAQCFQLERFPQFREHILSKMEILTPSQKLNTTTVELRARRSELVVTFVGRAFFRKGGWEMLKAFSQISNKKHIRLNIVSGLETEGFMDEHVTPNIINEVKRLIRNDSCITYFEKLKNAGVMELFKHSDIAILPSYAETYGYSLLEAMSCGCAVIAADISPFSEFVSDEWGWLLKVPVQYENGIARPRRTSENPYEDDFSRSLINSMKQLFEGLFDNWNLIMAKRQNAIGAIRRYHDPEDRVQRLSMIYEEALQKFPGK